MSEHQIIAVIRASRRRARMFDKLSYDGRRRVLIIADGDDFMIDEIIADVLEDERDGQSRAEA